MGSSNCISNDGKNYKRDDYYDLVEKKMKGAINDNKYNLNNQNISLESADFKSNLYNNLQNTKNKVNFFIPWKSHLIVYLNSLTYNWAKNLLNYIEECNFSNENKFESQLFYEEFKIMTCPKIIKKKEKENKENFKDDINDDTLKNPYLDFSKDLTESILSDDSNNNLIDLRKEDKINKETRKEYCKVFKEQIYKEDHPIYIIITKFNLFFVEEIDNKIEEIKNEENENIIKKNCEDFITQIQDFILEVHIIFKLFYSRTISLSSFSEEKDELINLIIGVFFNIGNFYEKMKKLLFYLNKNKINLYKEKIELFSDIRPNDLGINEKFCLNDITREYQENLKKNKKEDELIEKKEIIDTTSPKQLNLKLNIEEEQEKNNYFYPGNKFRITSESSKLQRFTNRFSNYYNNLNHIKEPYEDPINFLKEINNYNAPFEKLIIIASLSSLISESIDDFYKDLKEFIKPSMLNIGADELTSIYLYIIIKVNLPELFIYCDLIEYFTVSSTKSNMFGFYFSTVKGVLNHILEVDDKSKL